MELKYVKLLKDNNMSLSDLPAKVKVGVSEIEKTQRGIKLANDKGQKVRQEVLDKLEWLDEQICGIITSTVESKDKDAKEAARTQAEAERTTQITELTAKLAEYETAEAARKKAIEDATKPKDEKVDNTDEVKPGDPKADQIDKDCEKALKDGKTKVKIEDLKGISKTAYDIIFESYKEGEENGVVTSHYSVLETEKELFTISKN